MKLEKLNKLIEEQNEEFKNASPAEKRVIIAKDCIERIKLNQILPDRGCLIEYDDLEEGSIKNQLEKGNIINCQACAKGGLFLSYIGRVNNFDRKDFTQSWQDGYNKLESSESIKLLELFEPEQLILIETAFEGYQVINDDPNEEDFVDLTDLIRNESPMFYRYAYPDDMDRLIQICQNIIRNKGTFIWSKIKP